MKKYFYVETDEGLQVGDVISLTIFKELEDGKVTIVKDVEFNEATKDWFINLGCVEEREVEEEEEEDNSLLDFHDEEPCEELPGLIESFGNLVEDFETLEERVDKLENKVDNLITVHHDFVRLMTDMLGTFKEVVLGLSDKEEKKNGQPKKK